MSRKLHRLNRYGKEEMTPRGRRARHVTKVDVWKVGDPSSPSKGVLAIKYKSEIVEITIRESDGSYYR